MSRENPPARSGPLRLRRRGMPTGETGGFRPASGAPKLDGGEKVLVAFGPVGGNPPAIGTFFKRAREYKSNAAFGAKKASVGKEKKKAC